MGNVQSAEFADEIYYGRIISNIPSLYSYTWGKRLINHPYWQKKTSSYIPIVTANRLTISVDQAWKGWPMQYKTVYWPANNPCVAGSPPNKGDNYLIYAVNTGGISYTGYFFGSREALVNDSEIKNLSSAYRNHLLYSWFTIDKFIAGLLFMYIGKVAYKHFREKSSHSQ